MNLILLDLFCGAGGGSVGFHHAGFDVVGVDINMQKRYPYDFLQMDALDALRKLIAGDGLLFGSRCIYLSDIAVIAASPPCQVYSVTASLSNGNHPDLVAITRDALIGTGKPYVIENVPGSPLINPLMLCGTMFGLRVIRHRLFECNPSIWFPPAICNHWGTASSSGRGKKPTNVPGYVPGTLINYDFITVAGSDYIVADGRIAMGIDWMTKKELSQAIPPAYTEFIGKHLIRVLFSEV